MIRRLALALALAAACLPSQAEVTSVSPGTLVLTYRRDVAATPAQAFQAVGRVEQWWNAAHSYSGQGSNLKLPLNAGGCFCESWNGNSVEHGRVIMVMRDSVVRLEASLGPLQQLAVHGVLTFSTGSEGGKTYVKMVYRVSGSPEAGLDKLGMVVDSVMGDQFERWAKFAEK